MRRTLCGADSHVVHTGEQESIALLTLTGICSRVAGRELPEIDVPDLDANVRYFGGHHPIDLAGLALCEEKPTTSSRHGSAELERVIQAPAWRDAVRKPLARGAPGDGSARSGSRGVASRGSTALHEKTCWKRGCQLFIELVPMKGAAR